MSDAVQAQLRIASGVHSVNKLFCLPCPHAAPQLQPTCAMPITAAVNEGEPQHEMSEGRQLNKRIPEVGVVVFFVGDQLEAMGLPPRVLELQNPRAQAALMADKFRGSAVAVVVPSRYEGGCASYDHFLHRTTATGEPLGYAAGGSAGFKAAAQLASLLTSVGLWPSGCKLSGGQKAPLTSTGATSEAAVGPSTSKLSVAVPVAVHLVGFSKGGVVLNQLLTELAEFSQPTQRYTGSKPLRPAVPLFSDLPRHPAGVPVEGENVTSRTAPAPLKEADERTAELLRSIQCVHYLDAGLNGRGGYLTDPSVRCYNSSQALYLDYFFMHSVALLCDFYRHD